MKRTIIRPFPFLSLLQDEPFEPNRTLPKASTKSKKERKKSKAARKARRKNRQ